MSEYKVPVFLPPEIRVAIIKDCGDKEIDKIYCCQQHIIKSLYCESKITEEVYKKYMQQFSKKITCNIEAPKPLTYADMQAKQKIDEETRYFRDIKTREWSLHLKPEWRQKVANNAKQWAPKIPEAAEVLEIAKKAGYA